jgi:hypothetical protein
MGIRTLIFSFFSSVVVAVFTAVVTVRLALRRFYAEKSWERKSVAYGAVLEALHHVRNHADTNLTFSMRGKELPPHGEQELTDKMRNAMAELRKQLDIGDFLLSESALLAMRELMSGLEASSATSNWQEHLELKLAAIDKCLDKMRRIARSDLRLATSNDHTWQWRDCLKGKYWMSADNVFTVANWVLVGALLVGVAATYAIVVSGKSRDEALKSELAAQNTRAAELARQTEILKLSVGEAEQRAAEAKLALEKFKAPRVLNQEQQSAVSAAVKPFAGTIFDAGIGPKGDPEPLYLLRSIHAALVRAGWKPVDWTGGGETYLEPPMPKVGLTMVTDVIIDVHPDKWTKFGDAANALASALAAAGIAVIADSQPTSVNTDAIHVRIGRKQ